MQNDILASLSRLSDTELVARMKSLVAREREATAGLVAHLAEMDTRDVYLREGRPRRSRVSKPGAQEPSAAVKRAVWVRDVGRCAFIGLGDAQRSRERPATAATSAGSWSFTTSIHALWGARRPWI